MPEEVETPTTPAEVKLLAMKAKRGFLHEEARVKTRSLGETLRRIAEVELVCAALEEEVREGKA